MNTEFVMSELIGTLTVGSIAIAVLVLAEVLKRTTSLPTELTRKFAHIGSGLAVLLIPAFIESSWTVLALTGAAIRPGVTTDELDAICHDACIERGGYPSPLNYNGFPKSLCTSVNEVICHGIPDDRPLTDGDICNLDVTFSLDGVHGDTNATFLVGEVDDESRRLVDVTRECLERAIAVVAPGVPFNEIGRAIQEHAEGNGFGVVRLG